MPKKTTPVSEKEKMRVELKDSLLIKEIAESEIHMMIKVLQKSMMDMIAIGMLEKALESMYEFIVQNNLYSSDLGKTVTLLKGTLAELNNNDRKGNLSLSDYSLQKNQISSKFIDQLANIENLVSQEKLLTLEEPSMLNQEITVVIDRNIESYSDSDKESFVTAISNLLNITRTTVKIIKTYPGSVNLVLSLPIDSALKLYMIAKKGELSNLGVIDTFLFESVEMPINSKRKEDYHDIGVMLGLNNQSGLKKEFLNTLQEINRNLATGNSSYGNESLSMIYSEFNKYNDQLQIYLNLLYKNKRQLFFEMQNLPSFQNLEYADQHKSKSSAEFDYLKELIREEGIYIQGKIDSLHRSSLETLSKLKNILDSIEDKNILNEQRKQKHHDKIEELERGYLWGVLNRLNSRK